MEEIKIFGSILVILGCTLYGYFLSANAVKRKNIYEEIISFLDMLINEISYSNIELSEIIHRKSSRGNGLISLICNLTVNSGDDEKGIAVKWREGTLKACKIHSDGIKDIDCQRIADISDTMQKTHRDELIGELKRKKEEFIYELNKQREMLPDKLKLYRCLGICSGFMLVLFFI